MELNLKWDRWGIGSAEVRGSHHELFPIYEEVKRQHAEGRIANWQMKTNAFDDLWVMSWDDLRAGAWVGAIGGRVGDRFQKVVITAKDVLWLLADMPVTPKAKLKFPEVVPLPKVIKEGLIHGTVLDPREHINCRCVPWAVIEEEDALERMANVDRPPPCDCRRPAPLKGQLTQYGYFYQCAGCNGLVPGYRVGTDGIELRERPSDRGGSIFPHSLPPGTARGAR